MKNLANQRFNKLLLSGYTRLLKISTKNKFYSYIFFTALLAFGTTSIFSQSAGDYRSGTGNISWGAAASWQKFDGTSWSIATDYPGQNPCSACTITIQDNSAVSLNVSPVNPVGNIIVGTGTGGSLTLGTFKLMIAGDLTVGSGASFNLAAGSLSVGGNTMSNGTITDASNTGVNTFTGLVTNNGGSWNSAAVVTAANLILIKGFTNAAGAFTAGAATIGDSAVIDAASAMDFKNIVAAAGLLTVKGTGGVKFSYNTSIAGDLFIAMGGSVFLTSAGFITVTGATTVNGSFTDLSNNGINTFTKLVTNNGTFNTDSVSTASNLRLNGGFFNETGAACIINSARLASNITGNAPMIVHGAVTTNGPVTISGGEVTITGGSNVLFSSLLTISAGASFTLATTGNFTAGATINAGNLTDNDNTSETIFTGLLTNSGTVNFSALSTPHVIFNRGFVHSGTVFNVPTATISTGYSGYDITATSPVDFSGGVNFTGTGLLSITGAGGVTFSGNATISIPAALQVAALSSLTVSTKGNFTVTGTTTLAGSFTDNDNTGITTFTGLITKTGGAWNSTAVTTAANMIFLNGVTQNAGTFNAGGASVPNGTTLKSTPAITFNNAIEISGAGNITIAGTGGVVLAGTGTNYIVPGNLSLTGLLTISTTGNFTVSGTTSIILTGGFTDNDNTGITTFNGLVTHNSTGKWTTTAVTSPANLLFNDGFTNTAGAFAAGAATVEDNKVLRGTVNMAFSNGLAVRGNGDITIAGTATNGVSFGGTLANYNVRNLAISGRLTVSTTGNLTVLGTTVISSTGNFLDNNTTGVTTFTGLLTVGATGTFTTSSVNVIGRLIIAGGIIQNNTTAAAFSAGTIRTTASQTWTGAGGITTTGIIDVNAGTLTNNLSGTVTSGGTLTGTGTSWIQGTNAKLALNSSTPFTITTLVSSTAGNTITYGSTTNATIKAQPYFNLTIGGSNNKYLPAADVAIAGSLTINSGILNNTITGKTMVISGNWINNAGQGAYNAGNGAVIFNGNTTQTLGGTSATTFKDITIKNPGGVVQTASCIVTGILSIEQGNITTGSNTVAISSTGSVERTGGYINGREQIYFTTGSSIARTFDVGDAANYAPVYLIFSGVTRPGNITVKTTGSEHPMLANSELNSNLSVNRYWTVGNDTAIFNSYTAVLNFVPADRDPGLITTSLFAGTFNGAWLYPAVSNRQQTNIQVLAIKTIGDIVLAQRKSCTTAHLVVNNPSAVCLPATADLTAAAVTAGSDTGLVYSYWTNAIATNAIANPSLTGVGTYYIKGTLADGSCSDIKPVVVKKQNPSGDLTGTTSVCTGDSASLNLFFTGTAPWTGSLSDGTTFSSDSNWMALTLKPLQSFNYKIASLTDNSGCLAQTQDKTGAAVVTVVQPATQAVAGEDQTTCGEFITLVGNTPSEGTGTWSIVEGDYGSFSDTASPATNFYGLPGITYSLRWSISNAVCPATIDDVTVKFVSGLWTGAKDTAWTDPENWCGGIIPTGPVNLSLAAGLRHYPVINDSLTINNLFLTGGASITINGVLTINGSYRNTGILNNRGTIILAGSGRSNFPGQCTITAMKNLKFESDSAVVIDKSFVISGVLSCLKGTVDLNDKYITLKADSNGEASVGKIKGKFLYSHGGRFIVQRYLAARKAWRLLTAPVTSSNSILSSWQNNGDNSPGAGTTIIGAGGGNGLDGAGNSTLKRFDTASQTLVPVLNTTVPISPGTFGSADNAGYFMFVKGDRSGIDSPATATTLSETGKLQTGNQIHRTAYFTGKYTLVGNPYLSQVDFGKVEKTNIINRFYIWNPTLNQVGGYTVLDDLDEDGEYSSSIGLGQQGRIIASHQAFFVQTKSNAYGSVIFHEADKYDSSAVAVVVSPSYKESLSAELYLLNGDSSTLLADGARIEFDDKYSNEVDTDDALKFGNVNENFSWQRDGVALAIERRRTMVENDTLFLKLDQTSERKYQLKFTGKNIGNHDLAAFLIDKYLGTKTKISLDSAAKINFSVTADSTSKAAKRFSIVFRATNFLVNYTNIRAYKRTNNITVDWTVARERGIVNYEIQKSVDGINYVTIATVAATANNNGPASYSVIDLQPQGGNNFYRIMSTDLNKENVYSQVINVKVIQLSTEISIYPNPVKNNIINIRFNNQPVGKYLIQLNAQGSGQKILASEIVLAASNNIVPMQVTQKLSSGIYNLKITGPDSKETILQVLVQ